MTPELRQASWGDVAEVAANLREADRAEVAAARGSDVAVLRVARECWLASRDTSYAWRLGDQAACIFGVEVPTLLGGDARPWMLMTDAVAGQPVAFLRGSRRILGLWTQVFPRMSNYVDARNEAAVRWVEWLGFVVHSAESFGPYGLPFRKFELEK